MNLTKETFINSLKSNYIYPDPVYDEIWECTRNVQDALYFLEYYSSETNYGQDTEGTMDEYFQDFKDVAILGY